MEDMNSVLMMWLLLIIIFVMIEIITLGLTTVWFAGGSIVALIAGICGVDVGIQIVLFFVVSIAMLYLVRPSACRKFNSERIKTDIASIVGAEGKVVQEIDNFNQTGCVFLDGKEWTARSADGTSIEVGAKVTVNEISGVKLIVTKNETITMKNEKEEK